MIFFKEKQYAIIKIEGQIDKEIDNVIEFVKNADKHYRGLIIRINSPGGEAYKSLELYSIIKNHTIPIFVVMDGLCASGALMIACGAEKVFSNYSTITGSIGVVIGNYNIKAVSEKIGITEDVISTGDQKNIFSLFRDKTEKNKEIINEMLIDPFEEFYEIVEEKVLRNIENVCEKDKKTILSELEKMMDGRIISGKQAYDLFIIDHCEKGIPAIELAKKKMIEYNGDYKFKEIDLKRKLPLWKKLLGIDSNLNELLMARL